LYFVYYSYAIVCQFVSLYTMSYFIHQFLCCYSIADILGSLSGVRCYLSYNLLMCICIIFCEIFMLFEICYCCLSSLISISQTSSLNHWTKLNQSWLWWSFQRSCPTACSPSKWSCYKNTNFINCPLLLFFIHNCILLF
jgi:hypothetical protein